MDRLTKRVFCAICLFGVLCCSFSERKVMKISILGTGCPKCKKLAENAEAAAKGLALDYEIEKVTDINDIMKYGVMMTPALAIEGKVVSAGKALGVEDIKPLLQQGGNAAGGAAPSCSCGGSCC